MGGGLCRREFGGAGSRRGGGGRVLNFPSQGREAGVGFPGVDPLGGKVARGAAEFQGREVEARSLGAELGRFLCGWGLGFVFDDPQVFGFWSNPNKGFDMGSEAKVR